MRLGFPSQGTNQSCAIVKSWEGEKVKKDFSLFFPSPTKVQHSHYMSNKKLLVLEMDSLRSKHLSLKEGVPENTAFWYETGLI